MFRAQKTTIRYSASPIPAQPLQEWVYHFYPGWHISRIWPL